MRVYRMDPDGTEPIPVECEVPGWPNRDASGETMYDNTHFRTLDEAWESQRRDVEAHVSLSGRSVQEARDRLRKAEENAARAAERFAELLPKYEAFRRQITAAPAAQKEVE